MRASPRGRITSDCPVAALGARALADFGASPIARTGINASVSGSVVMFDEVFDAMHRSRCRFVVVGSVARALAGERIVPHDLDVMVDASTVGQRRLCRALTDVGAIAEARDGWRPIERCPSLPWEWGFRVLTAAGQVDLITRFVDGTTIDHHDAHATTVRLRSGFDVRIRPTRHVEAA